jgi:uncharacterized protein with PQ loop repeat
MINMETIGYLGGLLLAICSIPEVIRTLKDKRCHLGWPFLSLWFFGEVFMIIYALNLWDFPLIFNYAFNIVLVSIMLFFKIKNLKKWEA